MKVSELAFVLATLLLLTGCSPALYSKRELRAQTVPKALQNRTWTLTKLYSEKILDALNTTEFNDSNGTGTCSFTFQFADKGELIMSFNEHKFNGVYLVDGHKFKLIYDGFRDKIVWTTNPECKITPTELGYVLNWREFEFQIQGHELTLKNNTGDSLVMTTNN